MTSPGMPFASRSLTVKKLPRDLAIFSPSTCRNPLCIQTVAMRSVPWAQQLWASSFSWCGKARSMPPPWMSKTSPSRALGHGAALDVPAGAAAAPGAVPAGLLGRRGLPEHEVHRAALVGRDLDAAAGDHVVGRAPRQRAVAVEAVDGEQHVALGLVGVAPGDQLGGHLDHLRDVFGAARLVRRAQRAQRVHVLVVPADGLVGQAAGGGLQRLALAPASPAPRAMILSSTSVKLRT